MAKDLQISLLLDFYGEMLTEKQREMIEFYYNEDLSLAEIADNQGITRQGVRESIMRAEAQLLVMEERLGLANRFHEMREGLSQICDAALRIEEYNQKFIYSCEVEQEVKNIIDTAQRLCED